jgi:hypothetical protein
MKASYYPTTRDTSHQQSIATPLTTFSRARRRLPSKVLNFFKGGVALTESRIGSSQALLKETGQTEGPGPWAQRYLQPHSMMFMSDQTSPQVPPI